MYKVRNRFICRVSSRMGLELCIRAYKVKIGNGVSVSNGVGVRYRVWNRISSVRDSYIRYV